MSVRTEAGNPGLRPDDHRLLDLADHLDYRIAERVRTLVAADSMALRVEDLVNRAERAEDLATEVRRQMVALERQLAKVRNQLANAERKAAR